MATSHPRISLVALARCLPPLDVDGGLSFFATFLGVAEVTRVPDELVVLLLASMMKYSDSKGGGVFILCHIPEPQGHEVT